MTKAVRGAIAALLFLSAAAAMAAPRIALVTMQPGEAYWSRFGHNAILVVEDDGRATHYNYGYFDFTEPGFLLRFLQGRMEYRLAALPADEDLSNYAEEGRGVSRQWLTLDQAAARELAGFLAWNARPENARYRYDYFTDNCSTRVRDALDRALGGTLRQQLSARSRGLSYRWEALRLGAPEPWLFLGMHAGLGPFADRPLSRWEESFVPMRLQEAVREVSLPDGRPLVAAEEQLLPHRVGLPPAERPSVLPWFAAAGFGLGTVLLVGLKGMGRALARRGDIATAGQDQPYAGAHADPRADAGAGARLRKMAAVLAALIWLFAGLGGLLLASLWAFTDHRAAWGNENVLLFTPLALPLLAAVPALWRGMPVRPWLWWTARLVVALALLAGFLKFLPWRVQDNLDWIAFWLPIHAALAFSLRRMMRP